MHRAMSQPWGHMDELGTVPALKGLVSAVGGGGQGWEQAKTDMFMTNDDMRRRAEHETVSSGEGRWFCEQVGLG